jgi:hypothetical protein
VVKLARSKTDGSQWAVKIISKKKIVQFRQMTWRESSGRVSGPESYQFGDLSRFLIKRGFSPSSVIVKELVDSREQFETVRKEIAVMVNKTTHVCVFFFFFKSRLNNKTVWVRRTGARGTAPPRRAPTRSLRGRGSLLPGHGVRQGRVGGSRAFFSRRSCHSFHLQNQKIDT